MALKIGILTLPIAENYGGILQAIALYRLLENEGHDVVLIYKKSRRKIWKDFARRLLLKVPFHNFMNIKSNNIKNIARLERIKFHRPFIEKEILNISKDLYTKHDLEKFTQRENFDAVIVGSDQVWRKAYINDKYYKSYFLDFVDGKKVKKISYAASFGKDEWEGKEDVKDVSKLLQDFTAISVREVSGVDVLKNTFKNENAVNVLDPTLLMSKEFYINEIISKYGTSKVQKGGIVTYVLDEAKEKREIIRFVKEKLEIENLTHLKGFNNSKETYSVPEWLASFANADFVITDSFHGMVFSIIFEKEFVVIGNPKRGIDRFLSLLSLLKLENRLIFDLNDLEKKDLKPIDYSRIKIVLDNEKKKSKDFLLGALNAK